MFIVVRLMINSRKESCMKLKVKLCLMLICLMLVGCSATKIGNNEGQNDNKTKVEEHKVEVESNPASITVEPNK